MKLRKVTRKFMLNLADRIYNPKTRTFLRLCGGELTNGPDPTNKKRRMHCGLGELFYAITGLHIDIDDKNVNVMLQELGLNCGECDEYEDLVVELAVRQSTLVPIREHEIRARLYLAIQGLDASPRVIDSLGRHLDAYNFPTEEVAGRQGETEFRELLVGIPKTNDEGATCDGDLDVCSAADYRSRSRRVAAVFREAAKLLPK